MSKKPGVFAAVAVIATLLLTAGIATAHSRYFSPQVVQRQAVKTVHIQLVHQKKAAAVKASDPTTGTGSSGGSDEPSTQPSTSPSPTPCTGSDDDSTTTGTESDDSTTGGTESDDDTSTTGSTSTPAPPTESGCDDQNEQEGTGSSGSSGSDDDSGSTSTPSPSWGGDD